MKPARRPRDRGESPSVSAAAEFFQGPNLYTDKDIALLESVSEQIAIAIDSKRTEKALFESEKMDRTLFDNVGDAILAIRKELEKGQ